MFTYIDSLQDLEFLNKELLSKNFLGVDTEFRRTNKENMKLALIQINDNQDIYLIDPILIESPNEQCEFLFSESVTKIFHSCKEDIEAVYSWCNRILINVFDTQIAEAFLDGQYSIGYQNLVEQELDIVLKKNETRSNWLRRPLTDSQLDYAVTDVEYLIHLFLKQREALIESGKLEWHDQEIQFVLSGCFEKPSIRQDIDSSLTKKEEEKLLNQFDEIVNFISQKERINPTLFFSRRNQKHFLRLSFNKGFEEATSFITDWRKKLIYEPFQDIIKGYL